MESDISSIADLLRSASKEVFNGKGKLCLSTTYLNKLNCLIDENIFPEDMNSSFHVLQPSTTKANLIRDVQFLLDLFERTISLKVVPDLVQDASPVNISKFKNLKELEFQKIDVASVLGLQRIRSQLKQITCSYSMKYISELLEKCGGDHSNRFTWNELKQANFSHNSIIELDDSFECTPWLQYLDLSHNELVDVSILMCLPNLKHLNLSFNKLVSVPYFKGQICNRLQILILKNNFIDDITGLSTLTNLLQVDLNQNCLIEHRAFLSISHLVSLQWLNVYGNPLYFHPLHRNLTCNYLNKNTATTRFVLDNAALSKHEKSLAGTLYPVNHVNQRPLASSHNSSEEANINSISEKSRRVRKVTIEDEDSIVKEEKSVAISLAPSTQHLEIKKQVEQLREEYGESWLYMHSGLMVQDVLGIEKSNVPLSSTPYDSILESLEVEVQSVMSENKSEYGTVNEESTTFVSTVSTNDESTPFVSTVTEEEKESTDGEDVYLEGEESIYLAKIKDGEEVMLVVTQTHISERDCTTSKETARWHVNTIISCSAVDENTPNIVQLDFNTVRRDRKQRIYQVEEEEAEKFIKSVREKIVSQESAQSKLISYQCMKCSQTFTKDRNNTLSDQPSVICPKCESNLVIENI